MAYYTARELLGEDGKGTGKWHYTVQEGGSAGPRTFAVGYCADGCPGHDTPKAADAHYKQYLLDHQTRYEPGEHAREQRRCEVPGCDVWTTGIACVGGYEVHQLCPAHLNREHLEPLVIVADAWEIA